MEQQENELEQAGEGNVAERALHALSLIHICLRAAEREMQTKEDSVRLETPAGKRLL